MLQTKNKLTVLHDNNSVFNDFSNHSLDYARDSFTIDLDQSDDYLYVGFEKPVNTFYIEISTANTNANEFTSEFYNGTAWVSLVNFHDDSKGFTRSGFLSWDRNQIDQSTVEINSITKYFIRLRPSVNHSSAVVAGLNIVFADDIDLQRELYEISSFLPDNASSFILSHVSARDHIIQELRNDGRYKLDLSTGHLRDITAFDLLDISQVKLPATYLCLSKIFMNLSDEVDDKYQKYSEEYKSMYNNSMKMFYLNVDTDNDGIEDTDERLAPSTSRMIRR